MVGLHPKTEPNHIFYWDFTRLIARSGWLHALGGKMKVDFLEPLDEPPNEPLRELHVNKWVNLKLHMKLHMKVISI